MNEPQHDSQPDLLSQNRPTARERRQREMAREMTVQALYQHLLSGTDEKSLFLQYGQDKNMPKADGEYFRRVLGGALTEKRQLEEIFTPLLDRALAHLDPIEHAILLLASFELQHCQELPYRVVINEAVELAKKFGATDGHRYINGVVDKLARQLRG